MRPGSEDVDALIFRFVHGSGFRTVQGHRFPTTGVRLEHDRGPCPGLRCSAWAPLPGFPVP